MPIKEKIRYREICKKNKEIPIFMQDWWLDAIVGPDLWDVFIVEESGILKAVWPFAFRKKDHRNIYQPALTQTGGIFYFYPPGLKQITKLSFEKEICGQLIDRMEQEVMPQNYYQAFHVGFTNWLPFYWKNYQQTTYYTYRISSGQEIETVWSSMSSKLRNEIKNSDKKTDIRIFHDAEIVYSMFEKTYKRRNRKPPYDFKFIDKIVNASIEKNQGKVYVAFGEGVALSAIFVVNDLASSYYLLGGSDYSIKNINANAVLLWHAAKDALDSGRDFDFEGSMNEGIEHFFRSFGAKQTPYFRISKLSSRPSDELKGNIRILYRDVKKIAKSLLKFSRGK